MIFLKKPKNPCTDCLVSAKCDIIQHDGSECKLFLKYVQECEQYTTKRIKRSMIYGYIEFALISFGIFATVLGLIVGVALFFLYCEGHF